MSRYTFFRALVVALVTALTVVPTSAIGARPGVLHASIDDTQEGVVFCGIVVDVVTKGVFTERLFFDQDGNPTRFLATASVASTLTAVNGGKAVTIRGASQFVEAESIVDEAAGTITIINSIKGMPEQIKTAHGTVLLRDAGIATFATTFDLETGAFMSSEVLFLKGPHPELDSDFTLFCEVITEALT
jgi:hypothetical protein